MRQKVIRGVCEKRKGKDTSLCVRKKCPWVLWENLEDMREGRHGKQSTYVREGGMGSICVMDAKRVGMAQRLLYSILDNFQGMSVRQKWSPLHTQVKYSYKHALISV